jgi:hypothetical protein
MKFAWSVVIVLVLFCTFIFLIRQLSYSVESLLLPKEKSVSNCSAMPFIDTVECLNTYVDKIYKYNKTDDSIELSNDDLIKYGGDCKNWAEFYAEEIQKYGFYGIAQKLQMNETNAHAVALLSSNGTYCVVDQQIIISCEKVE